MPESRPIVFLDRDGTLTSDHGYTWERGKIVLMPDAGEALRRLRPHFLLAIVTNQGCIGHGFCTKEEVEGCNALTLDLLEREGVGIDGLRYCPHMLSDRCDCRKPLPGMLLGLAEELRGDLAASWMIGDRGTDIEAGHAAGTRTILLPEPHDAPPIVVEPDFRAENLLEAAEIMLREDGIC